MERGSSGGPFFDQNNRVVGQLHGGVIGCAPTTAHAGRFDISWTGGGAANNRLSTWLTNDPNVVQTNTISIPTISGPSLVCSSGTQFTINNIPPVDSIIWTCGSNLSISSGQNTVSCNFSATGNVDSWVRARLVTQCGSITLPDKTVTGGITASFTGNTSVPYKGSGTWTASANGCTSPYHYEWFLREDDGSGAEAILVGEGNPLTLWSVPRSMKATNTEQVSSEPIILQPPTFTNYYLSLRAYDANNMLFITHEHQIVAYGDVDLINPIAKMQIKKDETVSALQLKVSPNPASNEATLEIIETSEQIIDTNTEWQIELYDAMQSLKAKVQKLKGRQYTISTTGWKDGVYIVRAKIGDEIITEKLVVKH